MACLSDLFLLVAEIWQKARSVPLLSDRYKAYMGGGGGGGGGGVGGGGGGVVGYPSERVAAPKGIYISTLTNFRNLNALVR